MTRSLCFRLFIATTTVWCISAIVIAEPIAPKTLDDIVAPVVVGTPPVNAFNGLFHCPDGEIRHYGDDGFLFSRDDGLTCSPVRRGTTTTSASPRTPARRGLLGKRPVYVHCWGGVRRTGTLIGCWRSRPG